MQMRVLILTAGLALAGCVTKPTDPVLATASWPGVDYAALAECTYASLPPSLANSQFTPLPSMKESRIVVGSGIEVGTIWTFRPSPDGAMLETRSSLIGDQAGLIKPYADACAAQLPAA